MELVINNISMHYGQNILFQSEKKLNNRISYRVFKLYQKAKILRQRGFRSVTLSNIMIRPDIVMIL